MPSLRKVYEDGLDFIEFLGERKTKTDKKELRDIYNSEFRREGGPNFSRLIHALQFFNKASIRQGKVILHVNPQVRLYYCDQWRSSTHSKANGSSRADHGGSTAPGSRQGAPHSSPSVNAVLTPKRQLAKDVLQKLKANRPQLISDKGGIEITSSPASRNGKVVLNIELIGTEYVVKFQIVNKGQKCIHFTFYTALHRIRCFTLVSERRVSRASPLLFCPARALSSRKDLVRRLLRTQISSPVGELRVTLDHISSSKRKHPQRCVLRVSSIGTQTDDVLVLPDTDIPTCAVSPYLPIISSSPSSDTENIDNIYRPTSPASSLPPTDVVQID